MAVGEGGGATGVLGGATGVVDGGVGVLGDTDGVPWDIGRIVGLPGFDETCGVVTGAGLGDADPTGGGVLRCDDAIRAGDDETCVDGGGPEGSSETD